MNSYVVPGNFPQPKMTGAVPGFQPKLLAVKYEGRFYAPGATPPERWERWNNCEALALQFVEKCRRNQTGKYAHLSQVEILEQYCTRVLQTDWGSDDELRWVIRRTAELLGWPIPKSASPDR